MKVLVVHQQRAVANGLAEFLHRYCGDQTLPLYDAYDALDHLFKIQFDNAWISVGFITAETLAALFANSVVQPRCRVILFGPGHQLADVQARKREFGYMEVSSEDEEELFPWL